MSRNTIKYTCFFTLLFMIIYASLPGIAIFVGTSIADAGDEEDIYKGVGIALLLVLVSQLGQSDDEEIDDNIDDPGSDDSDRDLVDEDLELLASIINAESRGEPYEGQVAVGAVVLNRVASPDFPNTVREVIYQPNQFTPVTDGQINLIPGSIAYQAAKDAMNGIDPSLGALFFYNPKKARTIDWLSQLETTVIIGDHVFAK
ncbi:MAG: cell wall hydrolase [Halanaerobiales bacterium]